MLYKVIKIPKWTPRFILKMLFGESVDYKGGSFNGDCVVPDGCTLKLGENKLFSTVYLGNLSTFEQNGYWFSAKTLDFRGESCQVIDSKNKERQCITITPQKIEL